MEPYMVVLCWVSGTMCASLMAGAYAERDDSKSWFTTTIFVAVIASAVTFFVTLGGLLL